MNRQIIMAPGETGIGVAVTNLQAHIYQSLPWVEKAYGLATDGYRVNKEQLTLTVPEVYVGSGQYLEMLPDDKNVSHVFFYADAPEAVVDEEKYDGYRMECNVSMVVWVDLDKIKAEMGYSYDHRYIDELKQDALKSLNTFTDFRVKSVETKAKEVWKGWTIGRGILYYGDYKEYALTQIFKHPEAGFRVYGRLSYEELCGVYIPPVFGDARPVTVVDHNGNTIQLAPGDTYTEAAINWPTVTDRSGETFTAYEGDAYVEPPVQPVTVINPNENTEVSLGEGEIYEVPLVTVADVFSLDFVFPADNDLVITAVIPVEYASVYTTQALTNVATVAYTKNGVAATLPIALAMGDTFVVTITRTAAGLSKVTLNS